MTWVIGVIAAALFMVLLLLGIADYFERRWLSAGWRDDEADLDDWEHWKEEKKE